MTARRRVLGLLPDGYGGSGGIAQFNRNLLEGLAARRDLAVEAIGLHGTPRAEVPAPLRWSVPRNGGKLAFALAAFVRLVRVRPALVVSGHASFGRLSWPLAALGRARLWTMTHGIEVWSPGRALDNAGLRRSDLVTTVSRCSRQRLLDWSGLPASRVEILPNAVDLERFRPGPRPEALARRYGVEGKRVLLTVARLSSEERYKGHDRVLPLLGEIDRLAGPVHYVIAGRGDDQPRLERLAREFGVASLATFAGFVPDDELEAHYRLADAYVMPSTGEGFGIVFLEALACGCPVVAGNRDGSVDALADGELGRLIDPDSGTELRDAIVATLRSGRRHDRAVPGVERFAVPVFHERVGQLVDRALDVGAGGGRRGSQAVS